ncbi:MAG TPA: amidohydrolase family protein [Actinomycetota bacterium]|nr:amidohydrolase family protein [Actinomycetota bacterium]
MDLVLAGGRVVTSLEPPAVVEGDVAVEGGRVAAVGARAAAAERIDCAGCVVIPGNVCAHHHLYSTLARGMPYRLEPPESFVQILQRIWWRLDRALDAETVRASAVSGAADALLAGTTTIVDHHASPNAVEGSLDVIAEAIASLGARSILCLEVSDRDGAGKAAAGLEESRRFLQREWGGDLVRGMVGAHASFTLSDETLAACVSLAERFGTGVHVHVAEDAVDERDALARFGRRVVHRLADAGALTERALLAHGVHLDDPEVELVRERGAWIAHNPRSNMHNRVGRAPVVDLGERVTLGTDGIDGDVFAECRAAYWRGREADPRVTPEWVLARLAASARFAGERFGEPRLGRVEPGAPADLVVLEYDPPTPFTAETLGGHVLFGFSARAVRDVVVNGSVVVRNRCLVRVDEPELRARSRELAERLWAGVEALPPHPFEPAGGA